MLQLHEKMHWLQGIGLGRKELGDRKFSLTPFCVHMRKVKIVFPKPECKKDVNLFHEKMVRFDYFIPRLPRKFLWATPLTTLSFCNCDNNIPVTVMHMKSLRKTIINDNY